MKKRTKRPKHLHRFDIELHRALGHVSLAKTLQEAINQLPSDFIKEDAGDAAAMYLSTGDGGFAVCFSKDQMDLNIVAHEIYHMAGDILDRSNIKPDTTNDEPGALLTGWLTGVTVKTLRGWGCKL